MIEKWDWYGQTACLAAAAQEAAEDSHTQWDRRHLTRKSNQTLSKNQRQQKSKQPATKFYEIHPNCS